MNKIKISTYKNLTTLVLLSLLLSACGGNIAATPTPIPLPAVGGNTDSGDSRSGSKTESTTSPSAEQTEQSNAQEASSSSGDASGDASSSSTDVETSEADENEEGAADNASTDEAASENTATDITAAQGIAPADASTPTQIDIERIGFSVPITPMDWRIVRVGDSRTTEWVIPEDAAGWHPDSAGAGATGNLVISGFQNRGSAVFSQLALGNVQEGQELVLTAADGSIHTYVVTEVGTPIPLDGTSAAERERVTKYYEQSEDARLTVVTGWPAFTTTHRLFVVAKLVEN